MPQHTAGIGPGAIEAALCFIVPRQQKPSYHSAAYTGGTPKIILRSKIGSLGLPMFVRRQRPPSLTVKALSC